MKTTAIFIPILSAAYAFAHGYVAQVTIDGTVYTGNKPVTTPGGPSVIRQIDAADPIKGATNPDVNCGKGAGPAALIANANPGSQMTVSWKGADGSDWPHNTGPMMTYMTPCQGECSSFDSSNADWFKIDEQGRQAPGGDWIQALVMTGAAANVTIPSTLAPGEYILRHEVIALHLAQAQGGAEFYEGCVQLKVGGSQTGAPTSSELVKLPGAYSDTDPGIFDPNVYDPNAPYTFPGPNVAQFVTGTSSSSGSAGSGSDSGSNASASASGSTPTATSSSSTATSTSSTKKAGTCRLKKSSSSASAAAATATIRPRHASRIMRRIIFGESH